MSSSLLRQPVDGVRLATQVPFLAACLEDGATHHLPLLDILQVPLAWRLAGEGQDARSGEQPMDRCTDGMAMVSGACVGLFNTDPRKDRAEG